ncbi:hypothetical protein AVEN_63138-1 [Araneus ventricosus]|uniref:Uncharacterized protein n=1 Tax=Araneus ventricosus TaxID=182803 RepID=A0A4Y2B3C8_ARAVE|nr:hypothetical protein AVEN_63138-1 [Araneus ventricosus]
MCCGYEVRIKSFFKVRDDGYFRKSCKLFGRTRAINPETDEKLYVSVSGGKIKHLGRLRFRGLNLWAEESGMHDPSQKDCRRRIGSP